MSGMEISNDENVALIIEVVDMIVQNCTQHIKNMNMSMDLLKNLKKVVTAPVSDKIVAEQSENIEMKEIPKNMTKKVLEDFGIISLNDGASVDTEALSKIIEFDSTDAKDYQQIVDRRIEYHKKEGTYTEPSTKCETIKIVDLQESAHACTLLDTNFPKNVVVLGSENLLSIKRIDDDMEALEKEINGTKSLRQEEFKSVSLTPNDEQSNAVITPLHKLNWAEQDALERKLMKTARFNVDNILKINPNDSAYKSAIFAEADRLLEVWMESNKKQPI